MKKVLSLLFVLSFYMVSGWAAAKPLTDTAAYGLGSSPIIGHTTDTESVLWLRTMEPKKVAVTFADNAGFKNPKTVAGKTDPARRFTARLPMVGLKPSTTYFYKISVEGKTPKLAAGQTWPSFKTLPDPNKPSKVKIGMGSCWLWYVSTNPVTFKNLESHAPDAFVWLGDNIYGDTLKPETLWGDYLRQRQVSFLRWMNFRVPQWAVWDDHDFGINNGDGTYPYKKESLNIFKDTWVNPSHGEANNPGIYTKVRMGGADLFLLDGRYHRMPASFPDGPGKEFLGSKQMTWLKKSLKESKAPFKLLVLGSPWQGENNPDSYWGYQHERGQLFDFIRDEKIEGVVLVRGDSHVGELNAIERKSVGGYDLYELVSSPIANKNRGPTAGKGRIEHRLRPVYYQDYNIGVLEVDTTVNPAQLKFMNYNSKNQPVWKTPFVLSADELKNGKGDLKKKMGE